MTCGPLTSTFPNSAPQNQLIWSYLQDARFIPISVSMSHKQRKRSLPTQNLVRTCLLMWPNKLSKPGCSWPRHLPPVLYGRWKSLPHKPRGGSRSRMWAEQRVRALAEYCSLQFIGVGRGLVQLYFTHEHTSSSAAGWCDGRRRSKQPPLRQLCKAANSTAIAAYCGLHVTTSYRPRPIILAIDISFPSISL